MSIYNVRPAIDLEEIAELETSALRLKWAELYGTAPAPRISQDVLVRAVAFRMQEDRYGRLSKSCRRQLRRQAEELRASGSIAKSENKTFKAGTKLIREWKGRVHEIIICDEGYVWDGKRYRSLSEIARSITGTRWSGPRFFGLEAEAAPLTSISAKPDTHPKASPSSFGIGAGGDG